MQSDNISPETAAKIVRGERLSPQDFGYKTIADDPEVHAIFEQTLQRLGDPNNKRAVKYKEHLDRLERGEVPTQEQLEDVWKSVNSAFMKDIRASSDQRIKDLMPAGTEVHHWNYSKQTYPYQVLDPRNLVILPERQLHELIHRRTTSDPSNIWKGPILEQHMLNIDDTYYPLAPKK